jgi:hypothetical protein
MGPVQTGQDQPLFTSGLSALVAQNYAAAGTSNNLSAGG